MKMFASLGGCPWRGRSARPTEAARRLGGVSLARPARPQTGGTPWPLAAPHTPLRGTPSRRGSCVE